jgi:hypothetical protein
MLCIFFISACCIGTCVQYFSQGLHHVLIYVSYNEILFLLYLFQLVQQHLYLTCERLRMAGLDDCSILQPGHLVESTLGGAHDSISVQNLSISRLHMLK